MLIYEATTGVDHKKRVIELFRIYGTAKDLLNKLQVFSELISINQTLKTYSRKGHHLI
jgi:hypothetical protein